MHRGPALLVAALFTLLALRAPGQVSAAPITIRLTDRVTPAAVTVAPGATVVFRNESGNRHRMRSVDHSGSGGFDTGHLEPGESAAVTFAAPGVHPFVDERDRDDTALHGTITVSGGEGSPAGGGGEPDGGSGGTGGAAPPSGATRGAPASASVSMVDDAFAPRSVEIRAGGSVTWTNAGGDEHTASARDGSWSSGVKSPGGRFSWTFPEPGTYGYLCLIHTDMQGTVVVRAAAGAAAPPVAIATPGPTPSATPEPTAATTGGEATAVSIADNGFAPPDVTVAAGSAVTWSNAGIALHTVTAEDGTFDSGLLASGGTWTIAMDTPGTWSYFCALHPSMTGRIQVLPSDAAPGGATPGPVGAAAQRTPAPASSPPIAVAGGQGAAAATEPPVAAAQALVVASGGAAVDPAALGRLGLVALVVAVAAAVFGRAVRGTVRPG